MRDKLARASVVGFSATPIQREDANMHVVFRDYIGVRDTEYATS